MVKTGGNPFFLNQFLTALYDAELLRFDRQEMTWVWQTDEIEATNMTDNVVELMIQRIAKGVLLSFLMLGCVASGNAPPVFDPIEPQSVTIGETLVIDVTAQDPEADLLVFSAFDMPQYAMFTSTPQNAEFRWAPLITQASIPGETYYVLFKVEASSETIDQATFIALGTKNGGETP